MKIIDILNDYAKGKIKEGFKFRYEGKDWVIENNTIRSTAMRLNLNDIEEYLFLDDDYNILLILNEEAEIIEEKPEPLEHIYTGDRYLFSSKDNGMTKEDRKQLDSYFRALLLCHDALVNAVNYLLEKEK